LSDFTTRLCLVLEDIKCKLFIIESYYSIKIKLRAYYYFDHLIEGAHAGQTHLVYVPVECYDRLLCENLVVEELNTSNDTLRDTIDVLEGSVSRVVVLIDVERAISTEGAEDVTVLREVFDAPNG
jgi:hypothetical protein